MCFHGLVEQAIYPVTRKWITLRVRSSDAIKVEGTPPWSLFSRFVCFNAPKSLLCPPNNQTVLNGCTMHPSLCRELLYAVALAKCHWFNTLLCRGKQSINDIVSWSAIFTLVFPQNASPSSFCNITIALMQDPFSTVLEWMASILSERENYCKENVLYKQLKRIDGSVHNGIWKLSFFLHCLSFLH